MVKYAFLILNYRTVQLTIKCINRILDLNRVDQVAVFIIDNDSEDNDYNTLVRYYKDYSFIHILKMEKNEGFSKGNNFGYNSIISKYTDLNHLIILNSDVFIEQKNFLDLIDEIFIRTNFFVCGPDIYAPSIRMHTNPMQMELLNGRELAIEEKKLEKITLKDFLRAYAFRSGLYKYYVFMIELYKKWGGKKETYPRVWEQECENIVLQGSCYIFSNLFIAANEQVFIPETFLYYEENILFARCLKNGWKVVYSPEIHVTHLLEGSSKSLLINIFKQMRNKNYVKRKSLKIYKNALEQWGLFKG